MASGTLRGVRRRLFGWRVVQQEAPLWPPPALGGPGASPSLGELLSVGGATWRNISGNGRNGSGDQFLRVIFFGKWCSLRFVLFLGISVSLLLCFSAFCFSAFRCFLAFIVLCFSASPLFCFFASSLLCFSSVLPLCFFLLLLRFSAFPCFSLLFCFSCFSAFCFSMLFCFSSFSVYLLFSFSAFPSFFVSHTADNP